MDVRMATALVGAVPNVALFCREQGISRQTFYKWRRRFAVEGVDGLQEHSRRPVRSPGATASVVEDAVVRLRKELADGGVDDGPDSIRAALVSASWPPESVSVSVPSRATIARILTRRGLVTPQPQKRPRSSMRRFEYARPNECWQSDWTQVKLRDGSPVAVAGTLDDHSRLLVGLGAAAGEGSSALVWSVMAAAIGQWGIPARSLTDNGWVYSGYRRNVQVAFETNLRALGVQTICSTPYHPQTCGKIERHWQTMKRWLTAQGPYDTIEDLNTALQTYRTYYNTTRPHRALHGATPAHAFAATPSARPAARPLPAPVILTEARVNPAGVIYAGNYLINVGRYWAGTTLSTITDGTHITLLHGTRLVRTLDADPTTRYQPAEPTRPRTHRGRAH